MSISQSLPITIVQMGHAEKLAEATQNQPVVQQQIAQETAKNAVERQKAQVSASEGAKDSTSVNEKEKKKKRQHPKKHVHGEIPSQQTAPDNTAPETGNILNITV